MLRSWALTDADGRVIQEDLTLRPPQLRTLIADVDTVAPHNAPHYVALAGGEEA